MKTPDLSSLVILAAIAGCAGSTSSDAGRAITAPHLMRARAAIKTGMPTTEALAAARQLLGAPTVTEEASTSWMMASADACTELRVVAGTDARVVGVTLFTVRPVSGAQFKECMAAAGHLADEPTEPETCPSPA
jgi:hypothetical protein